MLRTKISSFVFLPFLRLQTVLNSPNGLMQSCYLSKKITCAYLQQIALKIM